jgi:anaerobic selenocysteine-containing dehydrogenase
MGQVQHRVCNLCEAMCGLWIETEGTEIVSIKSNAEDVLSKGAFCPKSQYLASLYEDPDRLKKPQKRVGEKWIEIPWEQAFAEISQEVSRLQKIHGTPSLATYLGNPNVHNMGNMLLLPFFLKSLRTPQKYSATSVDQLPHQIVSYQMFGHQLLFPIADVDRTDFMLILGANPVVSNGSLLSAPGLSSRLKGIQKRGGRVVVVDPRYTETASLADEHLFIRPGRDAHFLLAFWQCLIRKDGPRLRHLKEHVKGWDELVALLGTYPIGDLEGQTGIRQEQLEKLVDEYWQADRAICYGRMGVSTQAYGTLCQWLIYLINMTAGHLDREGGVLFTKPAFDVLDFMARGGHKGSFGRRKSRVRQLPEANGEFPSATLADEILTPGKGQVRALFTIAGNPLLSLPDGKRLEEALQSLELYVAIDFYRNETTRLAHYILPPTSPLQHGHYDLVFNAFAVRNIARYSPPVLPKA